MKTPLEWALELQSHGYSVLPVGRQKKPVVRWRDLQTCPADAQTIQRWGDDYHPAGWGVITGKGFCVLDADTVEVRQRLEAVLGPPHVTTPRGGAHFYVACDEPVKTRAAVVPGLDVRGIGGYAVFTGPGYQVKTVPTPDSLYPWDRLPDQIREKLRGWGMHQSPTHPGEPILEGRRNDTLTSIAGAFRFAGMSEAEIAEYLLGVNRRRCQPPLPEAEVMKIAGSVSRYPSADVVKSEYVYAYERDKSPVATERDKDVTEGVTARRRSREASLSHDIEEWVADNGGRWFTTADLDHALGIKTQLDRANRRQVLHRLQGRGTIEPHPRQPKMFRYVDARLIPLDYRVAQPSGALDLRFPLGLEEYVRVYPGNVIVVAGAPNSGKTAFLLQFIRKNQDRYEVHYFCSEMSAAELRDRLALFPGIAVEQWNFKAIQRSVDFEQVLIPNAINVVDYLEMTTDLFEVNTHLTAMQQRVGKGAVLVAIQKQIGEAHLLGRGQEFSLEKPKLYLSMDAGRMTIVKGKAWSKSGCNPNGMTVNFEIRNGSELVATSDWRRR